MQVGTLKESLAVKSATLSNAEQELQETKANLEASSSTGDELAAQNGKVNISLIQMRCRSIGALGSGTKGKNMLCISFEPR